MGISAFLATLAANMYSRAAYVSHMVMSFKLNISRFVWLCSHLKHSCAVYSMSTQDAFESCISAVHLTLV